MKNGCYADNEYRAYPFDEEVPRTVTGPGGATTLPDATVVDFSSMVGLGVTPVTPYLHSISRLNPNLSFEFRGPVVAGSGDALALIFVVPFPASEFTTVSASSTYVTSGSPYAGACGDGLGWEGLLTVGRLADVLTLIATTQSLTAATNAVPTLPTLLQDLNATYVRGFNLANKNRTHATPPNDCTQITPPVGHDDDDYFIWQTCVIGPLVGQPVRLKPGYNCQIVVNTRENSLTVGAGAGVGQGTVCAEVPVYPGEVSPTGSPVLSGGPACDGVVLSVNGLSAKAIRVLPGAGVSVVPDPDDPNALVLDVDLNDMAFCGSAGSIGSTEEAIEGSFGSQGSYT